VSLVEFLALPIEQGEFLVALAQEVPLRGIAQFDLDRYAEVDLAPEALLWALEEAGPDRVGVRLHLREAGLPGDFMWRPHPNPAVERKLDMAGSLSVQLWISSYAGEWLLSGDTGLPGKGWYDDRGLDGRVPRRLKAWLEGRLRRLCPHVAVPKLDLDAVALGRRPSLVARASEGAVAFLRAGGRWRRRLQDIEYVPIPPRI
jgi:hypothetical protein